MWDVLWIKLDRYRSDFLDPIFKTQGASYFDESLKC